MTVTKQSNRFDELANAWDIAPQHVARTRDVADLIRKRVSLAGMSSLEIGAGTGLLSFALSDALGTMLATDPSQGMVDVLINKIRQSGTGNLRALRCGDDLADANGPFDLAMLQMALHHIPDVAGFLQRVHAKLATGGTLAIADLDTEDGSFHGPEITDVHLGFDRTEMVQWLSDAGFETVSIGTAHTMKRTVDGVAREYPIFLAIGRKIGWSDSLIAEHGIFPVIGGSLHNRWSRIPKKGQNCRRRRTIAKDSCSKEGKREFSRKQLRPRNRTLIKQC